jgi:predicted membrane protein
MSSFGKFIRTYPKIKLLNLLFYPILIYVILVILNLLPFQSVYSIIFWVCAFLVIVFYLRLEYHKLIVVLDTKIKQDIFFNETEKAALKDNSFSKAYRKWLIAKAEIIDKDLYYQPLDFNSGGECCIYCCTVIILFLLITSFSVIYIQGEIAWITAIIIFFTILLMYSFLRERADRKMYKLLDSEIKRILFEEETGYSPLKNGKFTTKYRSWLLQLAKTSRFGNSY